MSKTRYLRMIDYGTQIDITIWEVGFEFMLVKYDEDSPITDTNPDFAILRRDFYEDNHYTLVLENIPALIDWLEENPNQIRTEEEKEVVNVIQSSILSGCLFEEIQNY